MEKVTLKEILGWTGSTLKENPNILINNISKDTRTISSGDAYIALAGKTFDGHEFINKAFENGASFAIASKLDGIEEKYLDKVIKVDDTQRALNQISAGYITKLNIPVVAITGSVGKTTCKEMISSVLERKYKVLKTKENLNNNFGAPFTALELDSTYDVAVIEGGMNHAGELNWISEAIIPSVVVITNIGESHIGNLGSRENIFKAKCEMMNYMKDDAKIVLNKDDDYLPKVKDLDITKGHEIIFTGLSDLTSEEINIENSFVIYKTKDFEFKVNSLVRNIASAALLAREVGKLFNLSDDEIKEGIEHFNNLSNRMEERKVKNVTLICDYYNACFDSIKGAVESLVNYKDEKKRLIAVIGDVLELGDYKEEIHSKIGTMLNDYKLDKVYFVGDDIKNAFNNYKGEKEYFKKEDFMSSLNSNTFKEGDVVLLKASHGCKFDDIFIKFNEEL